VCSCARSSLAVLVLLAALAPAGASAATRIPVSGTASGRTFDGVGAISGGGGNARYLIDYPRRERGAILDYLFKPGYGAALQILKVEIGGDADSTDGAEASIEHTRGVVDCNAGYEWWLMRQARRRNPAIRLYALAWAAPGWTGSFWSQNTIGYLLDWLMCARRHRLRIDYLGGTQNERGYYKAWTERLRAALDAAGFLRTKIVMADMLDPDAQWPVATALARDAAFNAATSVVGDHDVCGYPTDGIRCRSTPAARRLGKPLWASELGALHSAAQAPSIARTIVRGYPQARLVAYMLWPIVSALPPGLPHQREGLLHALQPWSGHYRVSAMSYAVAMVTWFTAPGWRYVNGASGGLGGAGGYADGGYATLRSARGRDWSTIAETTTARAGHGVRFRVTGGLARQTVHVWRTAPTSRRRADWMVRLPDIHPVRGRFRFGLRPGYVFTFTTLARSVRRHPRPPRPRRFGAYVERPRANPLDETPAYVTPMDGAFEHRPCRAAAWATCIEQTVPRPPIYWARHSGFPYAVIGDRSLRDYTVSSDVLFTRFGTSAGVLARFKRRGSRVSNFRGYILALRDDGGWQLLKNSQHMGISVLAAGDVAPLGAGHWHNLSLTVERTTLVARIDGLPVGVVSDRDRRYANGIAGIEAGATEVGGRWTGDSWPVVQYRRLRVTPSP
jgi:hypothetical protein